MAKSIRAFSSSVARFQTRWAYWSSLARFRSRLVAQHAGQHDGQRLPVIDAVERRQLVSDHMRGPILRHAATDQPVEACVAHHIRFARTA